MNFIEKFDEWGIDLSQLTEKKQQTNKKIEYVRTPSSSIFSCTTRFVASGLLLAARKRVAAVPPD